MRPGPDWFTGNYAEESFRRYLSRYMGMPDVHFLQIGAYCGDASVWMTENILTGPRATLTDVDTWQGSNESMHDAIDFDAVFKFHQSRIARNVRTFVGTSDAFFGILNIPFDFIYIDGSHETHQVLRDAVNADRVLKVGGLLAFDDYMWSDGTDDTPRPAIDAFVGCFGRRYEVVEIGLQVWLRKVR